MAWFTRFTGKDRTAPAGSSRPRELVDPQTAVGLQREGAILLDVREQQEWSAGRAPKARHIPLGQLADRSRELPAGSTILTICRSGARSSQAARQLRGAGFTVINVSGGMRAWDHAGLPVVANGGGQGRVTEPPRPGTPRYAAGQAPTIRKAGGPMHLDDPTKAQITNRLNRARGQITGILTMLDQDRDCADILTQVAAVSRALDKTGLVMMSAGLEQCILAGPDGVDDRARLQRTLFSLG